MKVACTVRIGGKDGDNFKILPIDITIVVGSPGSGKTFFMINVAANCLGMGQKVIVIDPKNDFNKLYNVNKNIELIDISNVREGALNPFTFLRKKDKDGNVEFLDTSTLITIIECLCGKLDKETRIDIMPIVKDFVTKSRNTGEYVDMQDVADYLFQNNKENTNYQVRLLLYQQQKHLHCRSYFLHTHQNRRLTVCKLHSPLYPEYQIP
jgi:hypothetical protein